MSLRLVRATSKLEQKDSLHMARLLLLLRAAAGRKGIKPVEGITKLVKLDFLVRYPGYLERALRRLDMDPELARILPHERNTIESSMIRYRYGPWDARYRRWLALLEAKGLVSTSVAGRTVRVSLTQAGAAVASEIAATPAMADLSTRSAVVANAVGSYSGTKLKEFIYDTFPELTSMRFGEDIGP